MSSHGTNTLSERQLRTAPETVLIPNDGPPRSRRCEWRVSLAALGAACDFHDKVRHGSLDLAAREPARHAVIGASEKPDAVWEEVMATLRGVKFAYEHAARLLAMQPPPPRPLGGRTGREPRCAARRCGRALGGGA